MDDIRKQFRELSSELGTKNQIRQAITVGCQKVLDEIVIPTMRIAQEELASVSRVMFNMSTPSVLVVHSEDEFDSLVFSCRGNQLFMTVIDCDRDNTGESMTDIGSVSTQLIANKIQSFVQQMLRKKRAGDR